LRFSSKSFAARIAQPKSAAPWPKRHIMYQQKNPAKRPKPNESSNRVGLDGMGTISCNMGGCQAALKVEENDGQSFSLAAGASHG
jgi:hypothetical protein